MDPYAPRQPLDPYAPRQPLDPYAPRQPLDPYAPRQFYDRYARDAPSPSGQRADLRCYEVLRGCPSEAGHEDPTPAPTETATTELAGLAVAGGWSPPGSRAASRAGASRTASPVERAALGVPEDRAAIAAPAGTAARRPLGLPVGTYAPAGTVARRPLGLPVGTYAAAAAAARHPGAVAFVAPGEPWAPLTAADGGLCVGGRVVTPDNFEPIEVRYRHPRPRESPIPTRAFRALE